MNKTKQIILGSCAGVASILFVLVGIYGPKPADDKLDLQVSEDYKLEDTKDVIAGIGESIYNYDMKSAIKYVDSNIANAATKEEADKMVYDLVDATNSYINGELYLNNILKYFREYRVKPHQVATFMSSSEDKLMKLVYEKMNEAMAVINVSSNEKYIGENYLSEVIPDYQSFLTKYNLYLSEEFKDYLVLKEKTSENTYRTADGGHLYDILTKNMIYKDEFIRKYPESKYFKEIRDSLVYDYKTYFGYYPASKVFDVIEYEVESKALESYKENAALNLPLGEKAGKMVEGLKASGNKMTPELLTIVEEIGEVDAKTAFHYWYDIFDIEIPFEGADGYNLEEVTGVYEIDPETGEYIKELDPETYEPIEQP